MEPILVVIFFKKIIYLLKVEKNPTPQILEIYPTLKSSSFPLWNRFAYFFTILLCATNPTWKIVLLNTISTNLKALVIFFFKMHIVYIFSLFEKVIVLYCCVIQTYLHVLSQILPVESLVEKIIYKKGTVCSRKIEKKIAILQKWVFETNCNSLHLMLCNIDNTLSILNT